jgi:hypothetical protein
MLPPKLHFDFYRAVDWLIIGDRTSGADAPIAVHGTSEMAWGESFVP